MSYPQCYCYGRHHTQLLIHHSSVAVHEPLPGKVRRKLQRYPFERVAHHILTRDNPTPRTPRVFSSRAEEIRVKRDSLRRTLLGNLGLTEELLRFVRDCPDAAEWVKARVPSEAWARLEDPSEYVLPFEAQYPGVKQDGDSTECSDQAERPKT